MQAGLQLVHTLSAFQVQALDRNLPKVQDEHHTQRLGVVAVQDWDKYCPLTQAPHGSHIVFAVAVQARNWYVSLGHAVHETHGESVKYGHNVDSAR